MDGVARSGPVSGGVRVLWWALAALGATAFAVGVSGFYHLGADTRGRGVNMADGPGSGWYTVAFVMGALWLLAVAGCARELLDNRPLGPGVLLPLTVTMPVGASIASGGLLLVGQEERHWDGVRDLMIGGVALPLLLWWWNASLRRRRGHPSPRDHGQGHRQGHGQGHRRWQP
ncbi:hypothetical protein ABT354_36305 [Streptomyces sp. NPDC000594]|uniref:hypothetical protein n=1 Tax=Streptomyces sp. NPDC000594 TaxID=3154261 RepID=UPI00332DB77B